MPPRCSHSSLVLSSVMRVRVRHATARTLLLLTICLRAASAAALLHASVKASNLELASELAVKALRSGCIAAIPTSTGTVSLLLSTECADDEEWTAAFCQRVGQLSDVEPMWEPDDWYEPGVTFEPECIRFGVSSLRVQPLSQATSGAEDAAECEVVPKVLLLEHPHAFLTTAAGRLHASTLNILELLITHQQEVNSAGTFLDYGCGSGILSLAALAISDKTQMRAYGVDVHEPAIAAAQRNSRLNGCADRLRFGYSWELPSSLMADVAVANMMPGPLISVAADLVGRTREGGLLLVSGFRHVDVPAVRAVLEPYFEIADQPSLQRIGRADEAGGEWPAYACRRTAYAAPDVTALSESAL